MVELNRPTKIMRDFILNGVSEGTPVADIARRVIAPIENMIDKDTALRDYFIDQMHADGMTIRAALVKNALAWVDWTGIVNEILGRADSTCADRAPMFNNEPEETKEYQGWDNKSTWEVHLLMSNDEDTYNTARDVALRRGVFGITKMIQNGEAAWTFGDSGSVALTLYNVRRMLIEWELEIINYGHITMSFLED